MRWLIVLACACGARGAPGASATPNGPETSGEYWPPISVEWKVEQGDGNTVNVTLVVDGSAHMIGALDAATEQEAGTPSTCALRAASSRRTEIVCGDHDSFAADLVAAQEHAEIVVSHLDERTQTAAERTDVKRITVQGDVLAVKMLVLPGSKL